MKSIFQMQDAGCVFVQDFSGRCDGSRLATEIVETVLEARPFWSARAAQLPIYD
jgi:hypothetical protein